MATAVVPLLDLYLQNLRNLCLRCDLENCCWNEIGVQSRRVSVFSVSDIWMLDIWTLDIWTF
jgi:hypothetical protein